MKAGEAGGNRKTVTSYVSGGMRVTGHTCAVHATRTPPYRSTKNGACDIHTNRYINKNGVRFAKFPFTRYLVSKFAHALLCFAAGSSLSLTLTVLLRYIVCQHVYCTLLWFWHTLHYFYLLFMLSPGISSRTTCCWTRGVTSSCPTLASARV